jgi:hypothetical protein
VGCTDKSDFFQLAFDSQTMPLKPIVQPKEEKKGKTEDIDEMMEKVILSLKCFFSIIWRLVRPWLSEKAEKDVVASFFLVITLEALRMDPSPIIGSPYTCCDKLFISSISQLRLLRSVWSLDLNIFRRDSAAIGK